MMMEDFVQWATILSPLIAVGLAWWTSRRGARDTAKLVKSIKKLTKIQLQLTRIAFYKEYQDAYTHSDILNEKSRRQEENENSFLGQMPDYFRQREEKKENLNAEQKYYKKKISDISETMELLDKLEDSIEKM